MNRTCLVVLTIVSSFLANAGAYAAPSSPACQQTSVETAAKSTSEHQRDAQLAGRLDHEALGGRPSNDHREPVADGAHPLAHASRMVPTHTKQVPNNGSSASARLISLHQQGSNGSDDLAKKGLIRIEPYSHALPAPALRAVRPAMPLLNPVRHRDANSAAIGGPPNSARNAAINGTGMKRKP